MVIKKQKKIGKIIHYFAKLKVGVIKLSDKLKIGDNIRVLGGETDFDQSIKSIEIDKKKLKKADKGDLIGVKFNQKVRKGYNVYKI